MRTVKSRAGSVRAARAEATAAAIVDAGRELFATRGYAATTLREIAAHAGVAVQTVYAVFGSKANILRELRDAVASDPRAAEAFQAAMAATTADELLTHFARSIRLRWEAGWDVTAIHTAAAAADPAIRDEVEAVLARRRRGIGELAAALERLAPATPATRSRAIIDALTLPEVYGELTQVHSWSPDAYETWLADTLASAMYGSREGH